MSSILREIWSRRLCKRGRHSWAEGECRCSRCQHQRDTGHCWREVHAVDDSDECTRECTSCHQTESFGKVTDLDDGFVLVDDKITKRVPCQCPVCGEVRHHFKPGPTAARTLPDEQWHSCRACGVREEHQMMEGFHETIYGHSADFSSLPFDHMYDECRVCGFKDTVSFTPEPGYF